VSDLFDERYELGGVLGSGGTGTVHRAVDRLLDRPVAIKLLRTGALDDDVQRARLRAEARLAGALHHPGIARVYDYGEAQHPQAGGPATVGAGGPTPYIVMELVDGVPLSTVLRERRRLPALEVMTLVALVAEALAAAHRAGIVHRDLKPGNLLVRPDGRPVLLDFGIARSDDLEPMTLTGTIVGTVDYISPEQTRGGRASSRSDVYALGMVAYEALSGRRPFRRESQVATALAHLHDEVPPLEDDVPPAVAELVLQMVAKEPGDRPADAGEVAARAAALAGLPGEQPAADAWERTSPVVLPLPLARPARPRAAALVATAAPWVRSRRTYAGTAALAVVVALSFLVSARDPHAAAVRLPDLRGMRVAQAVAALATRDLDDVRRHVVDDPAAPRGTVLDQSPRPGAQASPGTRVVLDVASGTGRVTPRQLLGRRYAAAARRVVAAGLLPMRTEVTRAHGAGTVVAVGTRGERPLGSAVTLTVAVAPAAAPPVPAPATPTPAPAPAAGSATGRSQPPAPKPHATRTHHAGPRHHGGAGKPGKAHHGKPGKPGKAKGHRK